jgi:hypothetical protein
MVLANLVEDVQRNLNVKDMDENTISPSTIAFRSAMELFAQSRGVNVKDVLADLSGGNVLDVSLMIETLDPVQLNNRMGVAKTALERNYLQSMLRIALGVDPRKVANEMANGVLISPDDQVTVASLESAAMASLTPENVPPSASQNHWVHIMTHFANFTSITTPLLALYGATDKLPQFTPLAPDEINPANIVNKVRHANNIAIHLTATFPLIENHPTFRVHQDDAEAIAARVSQVLQQLSPLMQQASAQLQAPQQQQQQPRLTPQDVALMERVNAADAARSLHAQKLQQRDEAFQQRATHKEDAFLINASK